MTMNMPAVTLNERTQEGGRRVENMKDANDRLVSERTQHMITQLNILVEVGSGMIFGVGLK